MKKQIVLISTIFIVSAILIACSNDEGENQNTNNTQETESEKSNDNEGSSSDDGETGSDFEPEVEDQEGLGMSDTGTFDTIEGQFDLTVDEAELLGHEVDGIESQRADFILLDMTMKNIDDSPVLIEDLVESLDVTIGKDKSGSGDIAEAFDNYEKFEGELEPGEEATGQFIAEVDDSDTYYVKYTAGRAGSGASNQVIWEIDDEAM